MFVASRRRFWPLLFGGTGFGDNRPPLARFKAKPPQDPLALTGSHAQVALALRACRRSPAIPQASRQSSVHRLPSECRLGDLHVLVAPASPPLPRMPRVGRQDRRGVLPADVGRGRRIFGGGRRSGRGGAVHARDQAGGAGRVDPPRRGGPMSDCFKLSIPRANRSGTPCLTGDLFLQACDPARRAGSTGARDLLYARRAGRRHVGQSIRPRG